MRVREPSTRGASPDAPLADLLGHAGYRDLKRVLEREENFDIGAYRSAYLARRVRARLASVAVPPREYGALVARDATERRRLMESIGVNVTAFFRDPPVWRFLEEEAMPRLVEEAASAGRPLRAASLGCAGGQEAYSLAMLLAESAAGASFEVLAFDVDPDALDTARAAEYPSVAIAPVSAAAMARYFERAGEDAWRVAPALRRRVRVLRLNVLADPLPGTFDLVLCRNVLIYVDDAAKARLFAKIHGAVAPHGLLVLGQSEVILGPSSRLFRALSPRYRVYERLSR